MIAAAATLSIDGLVMSSFLGPKQHNWVKFENCKCDMEAMPAASGRGCSPIEYYLTAMTFTVFNVEVVFFYSWAISFHKLGLFGVVAMLSFTFPIAIPFVYEWYRGGPGWS